jgi:molybdopterin converting factor small subunit
MDEMDTNTSDYPSETEAVAEAEADSERIDPEVFEDALIRFEDALVQVEELRAEVEALDTPLSQTDTIALLYGRRNGLNKTEIKGAFETLDDVAGTSSGDLLKRLVADLGNMTQSDADEFLGELDRLSRKYGGED